MKQKLHFRNLVVSFFLLLCSGAFAQLADFTLTVTATDESCTANGVLNFTVSNTTAGATILYRIYHLPDTVTPIAVTPLTSFTGLVAGNYLVIATQSLGNESNTQQQEITVVSTIESLVYSISAWPEVCGNDGGLEVFVQNGNPVAYEIFSGPVIRPLQPSNIFNDLPGGNYLVRVFDDCGEGLVIGKTIEHFDSFLIFPDPQVYMSGCNNFGLNVYYQPAPGSSPAQPVSIIVTVYPPVGPPIVFTDNSAPTSNSFIIPAFFTGNYYYNITATNSCGQTYFRNNIPIIPPVVDPQVNWLLEVFGCANSSLSILTSDMVAPVTYTFSFPPGFNPDDYTNSPNSTYFFNPDLPIPNGNFSVTATDACGNTDTGSLVVSIPTHVPGWVQGQNNPGCQLGYGSLKIAGEDNLIGIELLGAPDEYTGPVPNDFTAQMTGDLLYFGLVPAGTYLFRTVDECNSVRMTNINVTGYTSGPATINITDTCQSFNLQLNHQTNAPLNVRKYYLQKRNAQNQWGHPGTGFVGTPGIFNSLNGRGIGTGNNNNLAYSGQFRIIMTTNPYYTGNVQMPTCPEILYEFEHNSGPKIIDVYSFVCENSAYDAIVVATGYAPLTYRITLKNGQPFLINNGNSNVFLGLDPAIYSFQIEDACGNILNSVFDISNPSVLAITPQGFCGGQNAKLTVPVFPFLDYQWWKGNDSGNILSTTNELAFPVFDPITDNGIYHVRIYYEGNPNSCIDFVVDYQIEFSDMAPNAGNDASASYCSSPGVLDLSTFLSGSFNADGVWQEVSSSGQLNDNLWNTVGVGPGNYQFRYTVTDLCNASDDALINIQIKPLPETPTAFLEQTVCDGGDLYLLATTVPSGTYQWSGPNGFTSTEQNPILTIASAELDGTYTVKAIADGCESGTSSITVGVNPLPLFEMSSGCVGGRYEVAVRLTDPGIDVSTVDISWSGPDNYINTGSPIDITGGQRGIYTATVTTVGGCNSTSQIDVPTTMCSIPTGVSPNNDSKNDVFDLTGFGVLKFKIYNRYGRMVFEQDDYTNQWHGQDSSGKILPDATYYYYLRLDTGQERTGWVYVTR